MRFKMMKNKFKSNDKIKGILRIYKKNKLIRETKNTITYTATFLLAKSITGQEDYRITHIYGEYGPNDVYTEGSTNGLITSRNDTIETLRIPPRTTVYAESPIIGISYQSTDENHKENSVTFMAVWDNPSLNGYIIVGAGLICQTINNEYLYAHAYFPAIKKDNEDLICHWTQVFD